MVRPLAPISPTVTAEVVQALKTVPGIAPGGELHQVELGLIRPDPDQPRRLVPPELHEAVARGQISPPQVLVALRQRAESEAWVREMLAGLESLARSIRRNGLINPVRVYEVEDLSQLSGRSYVLESGERRYWAHWLLVEEDEQAGQKKSEFRHIRAEILLRDERALQKQLAENIDRDDLTAIEKAQAFRRRREELLGTTVPNNSSGSWIPPDLLGTVVPARSGRPTLASFGKMTTREADDVIGREYNLRPRAIRNYLALLALPPDIQELAQHARLSGRALRPVVKLQDPAAQRHMLKAIVQKGLAGEEAQDVADAVAEGGDVSEAVAQAQRHREARAAMRREPVALGLPRLPQRASVPARALYKQVAAARRTSVPWSSLDHEKVAAFGLTEAERRAIADAASLVLADLQRFLEYIQPVS